MVKADPYVQTLWWLGKADLPVLLSPQLDPLYRDDPGGSGHKGHFGTKKTIRKCCSWTPTAHTDQSRKLYNQKKERSHCICKTPSNGLTLSHTHTQMETFSPHLDSKLHCEVEACKFVAGGQKSCPLLNFTPLQIRPDLTFTRASRYSWSKRRRRHVPPTRQRGFRVRTHCCRTSHHQGRDWGRAGDPLQSAQFHQWLVLAVW